jgi:hypothetical protein
MAAVAGGSRLTIVDASDPASPHPLGIVYNRLTIKKMIHSPSDLWLTTDIVHRFDASDARVAPTLAVQPAISWNDLALHGDLLAGGEEDLELWRVGTEGPVHLGTVPLAGSVSVRSVDTDGRWVVVAETPAGMDQAHLTVVDALDPVNPDAVGEFTGAFQRVLLGDGFALADYMTGPVVVVDLTDPSDPSFGPFLFDYTLMVTDGELVYARESAQIDILDLSDPSHPELRGSISYPGVPNGFVAQDGLFYANDPSRLYIHDVSDPASPVLLSETTAEGFPTLPNVRTVKERILYTYVPQVGFMLTDCSDPTAPVYMTSIGPGRYYGKVDVSGTAIAALGTDHLLYLGGAPCTDTDVAAPVRPIDPQFLKPLRPNPFRTSTLVQFDLPSPGRVSVEVYDVAGRRVRTLASGWREAGWNSVLWSAATSEGVTPTGVYFVRLQTADRVETRKAIIAR